MSSQCRARPEKAASTAAKSLYLSRMRRPSSKPPSPSIHTSRTDSPGARVTFFAARRSGCFSSQRSQNMSPAPPPGGGLGAVGPGKAVPQAVKAVRPEGRCHKLAGMFMEQLVVNDAVRIAVPGTVNGHLEILVVNGDLVIGKFGIGPDAEEMGPARGVFRFQAPQFHRLPLGDKQGLGRLDPPAAACIDGVTQPVAAPVALQIPVAGLPGNRPVFPGLVVPEVKVVPGPVHGHAVGPEAGDPVVLWAFIK